MVHTFGNPMKIRLTEEGAGLALALHRAAEARGDCDCGLLPPPGDDEGDALDNEALGGAAGGASQRSASPAAPPARRAAAPAAAPRAAAPPPPPPALRVDDDDCIVISDSDDEAVAAAAPAAAPRAQPRAQPAAKRPRNAAPPGEAPESAGGAGGAAAGGADDVAFSWKALPAWRLSSLSGAGETGAATRRARGAAAHALTDPCAAGVRLPPLPAGVPFAQEYDIVLLVDNREQFAHGPSGGRTAGVAEGMTRLAQRGVTAELRQLPIGDALWVARTRRDPARQFCLDWVVERKRLDDLESSIKDSRYKQQKYFLKRCALRHPVYLLEGDPSALGALTGGGAEWRARAVKSAMLSTEVLDGFQVLRTADMHATFDAYAQLTAALRSLYATLSGPRDGDGGGGAGGGVVGGGADDAALGAAAQPGCVSYDAFCAAVAAVRREAKTVRALWGLMLTQLPGVGGDVAEAVLWRYPTPAALRDAYAPLPRDQARQLLAPLKTCAVKAVGPVLSARIYDWVVQSGGAL
jgi:crossover junction endonuclease MUS81